MYPTSPLRTGLGGYSSRLLKGMNQINVQFEDIPVHKREFSFKGKPVFGNMSLRFGTLLSRPRGNVVHSLSPEVIHPRTNIVTVHDVIPLKMPEVFSSTYYRSRGTKMVFGELNRIEQLIVFSKSIKKEVVELAGVEADRVNIVHQSVDHELFYPEPDENFKVKDKKLILTIGDLNPRKRFDLVFNALAGNAEYQIIHIGPTNAWERRRKELLDIANRYDNIKMIGEVDQNTLRKYLSTADLLIHISQAEGFGSTPVEAMACGTNVLVNDLEIFKETLEDRAFYTTMKIDEIAKQADYAIKNKKEQSDLIGYSMNYSVGKMAENTNEVYKKIH